MSYFGGKAGAGVYQRIICQFPPHRVYIEPFLGAGAILRSKLPASVSYGLDLDPDVLTLHDDTPAIIATSGDGGRLELLTVDALSWLRTYPFIGDELIYADPPYLRDVRTSAHRYRCEFDSWAEHTRLLTLLIELPCLVAISGYRHEVYDYWLKRWRRIDFTAQSRGGPRTESLWCNYPEPAQLHDYRYLGADFRERERIKRKIARWKGRLAAMPQLERLALTAALDLKPTVGSIVTNGDDAGTLAAHDDGS